MLITFNGGVREKIMKGRKDGKTGGHIENQTLSKIFIFIK